MEESVQDQIYNVIIEMKSGFETTLNQAISQMTALEKATVGAAEAAGGLAKTNVELVRSQQAVKTSLAQTSSEMQKYNKAWMNASVERYNMARRIGNFEFGLVDPEYMRETKKIMADLLPDPKTSTNIAKAVSNIRQYNAAVRGLKDTVKGGGPVNIVSGIADKQTQQALATGYGMAFEKPLGMVQRLRLEMSNAGEVVKAYSYHVQNLGKQMQWTGRQMLVGMTLPIAIGASKAVQEFTQVNAAFTRLQRVFNEPNASAPMMKSLRDEAKKTSLTFHEMLGSVASVYADIASQGVPEEFVKKFADSVEKIQKIGELQTDQALNFQRTVRSIFVASSHFDAAGNFVKGVTDMGKSLKMTDDIMSYFVVLADKTNIHVSDLAQAFPEVANSANLFGLSAQQTAAILAGMYQNGIDAGEAANGLKFILQRIVNPTDKASESFLAYSKAVGGPDSLKGINRGISGIQQIGDVISKLGPVSQQRLLGDIGGLRQANRFVTALRQITDARTQIDQALQTIGADQRNISFSKKMDDATKGMNDYTKATVLATMSQKELRDEAEQRLNIVLNSPEEQFKKVQVEFHQVLYEIGADILPFVTKIGQFIVNLINKLQDLGPTFRKLIIFAAGFLAALGPIQFILGQVTIATGTMGLFIGKMIPTLKEFTGNVEAANKMGYKIAQIGDRFVQLNKSNPISKFFQAFRESRGPAFQALNELQTGADKMAASTEAMAASVEASSAQIVTAVEAQTLSLQELTAAWGEVAVAATAAAAEETVAAAEGAGAGQLSMIGQSTNVFDILKTKQKIFKSPYGGFAKEGEEFALDVDKVAADAVKKQGFKETQGSLLEGLTSAIRVGLPGAGGAAAAEGGAVGVAGAGGPIAAIVAIGVVLVALIPILAKVSGHWKEFWGGLKSAASGAKQFIIEGWTTIKNAFNTLKPALSDLGKQLGKLLTIFIKPFAALGEQSDKSSKKVVSGWKSVGSGFGTAAKGAAKLVQIFEEIVAVGVQVTTVVVQIFTEIAKAVGPVISVIGKYVAAALGFFVSLGKAVVALFRGNFNEMGKWLRAAMQYLAIATVQLLTPVLKYVSALINVVLKGVNLVISILNKIPGVGIGKVGNVDLKSMLLKLIGDPAKLFNIGFNIGSDAGEQTKKGIEKGLAEGLQPAGTEVDPDAQDALDSIFDNFLGALKSRLDEELSAMKQAAIDSLEAANAAKLKVYDDQIKAIDDLQKKEEELAATEEYLQRRKELLDKQALDAENYRRNRALAIYEGRIDDARNLDLEFQSSSKANAKDISNLDAERAQTLLKATRDAQKETIQAAKDAQAEVFKAQEDAFKKQLDLITQYTPRTVEEMKNMIDAVNGMLTTYGAQTLAGGYNDAFGQYKQAVDNAKQDLIQNAFWSGKDPMAAWLLSFGGLTPENLFGRKTKTDTGIGGIGDVGSMPDLGDLSGGDFTEGLDKGASKKKKLEALFFGTPEKQRLEDHYGELGNQSGSMFMRAVKGAMIGIFVGMPLAGALIGAFGPQLASIGKSIAEGIWHGFLHASLDWIVDAVNNIINAFKSVLGISSPSTVFMEIGADIMAGLVQGLLNGIESLVGFFAGLPGKLIDAFMQAGGFLERIGSYIMEAIASGMAKSISKVWGWFARLVPDGFVDTVKNIAERIINTLIHGVNGLFHLINKAIDFVQGVPVIGNILGWIGLHKIGDIEPVHFHTGGLVGGIGEIPTILQGGEYVIKKSVVDAIGIKYLDSINNMKFKAGNSMPRMASPTPSVTTPEGGEPSTNIYVDTFIGQPQWFEAMMSHHNIKVIPKKHRANGTLNRKVGSYKDNVVRYHTR